MIALSPWWYFGFAVVAGACGLALLGWSLFGDRSGGRRRCPKCWYSMEARAPNRAMRCPECGHTVMREEHLYKTRRRWRRAIASALPFALAGYFALTHAQQHGWGPIIGAATPATAHILLLQFQDQHWIAAGIDYHADHDLLRRRLVHDARQGDPMRAREAKWAWQWRWLGRTVLKRLENDELDWRIRIRYLAWLTGSRDFGNDPQLRERINAAYVREIERDDLRTSYFAVVFSVDYNDVRGSVERLEPFAHNRSANYHQAIFWAHLVLLEASLGEHIERLEAMKKSFEASQ